MKRRAWTEKETNFLIKNYSNLSNVVITKRMNRTEASVFEKARRLGLKKSPELIKKIKHCWSRKDEEFLKKNFSKYSNPELARILKKTPDSVAFMGKKFNLKKSQKLISKMQNRWTPKEEKFLIRNFPHKSTQDLAKEMKRSSNAIANRGRKLGLKKTKATLSATTRKANRISLEKRYGIYTKEMDDFLMANRYLSNQRLTDAFNNRFKTNKNWWSINVRLRNVGPRNKAEISQINRRTMNRIRKTDFFRENQLKGLRSPEHRRFRSKVISRLLKDPSFLQKARLSLNIKPNKKERMIIWLCSDLPIRFVGDGKFYVGTRNPDFKVVGQKKVIEHFGVYWHGTDLKRDIANEKRKISYFRNRGYDCLVIWEDELMTDPVLVRERIERFIEE